MKSGSKVYCPATEIDLTVSSGDWRLNLLIARLPKHIRSTVQFCGSPPLAGCGFQWGYC